MSERLEQDRRERERRAREKAADASAASGGQIAPLGLIVTIIGFVAIGWALVSCNQNMSRAINSVPDGGVAACVSRGIDYFREIGSYPTLSDGRDAATVATERCSRTTTAF